MSWRASAYFKQLRICRNGEPITQAEKLVGLVLADSHQDRSNTYTYPSVAGIAEDSLMTERGCRRILASLERKGEIVRVHPTVQFRGISTFYLIPGLNQEKCVAGDTFSAKEGGPIVPLPPENGGGQKGDHTDPLIPTEGGQKGDHTDPLLPTEGGQKGDRRGTLVSSYKEEQEQEPNTTTPPPPPLGSGASSTEPDQPTARSTEHPLGRGSEHKRHSRDRAQSVRAAIQTHQLRSLGVVLWPPAADRCLLALLKEYPEEEWPTDRLLRCVTNRFASDFDPADPPQEWLKSLPRFISGPKDRYRRPKVCCIRGKPDDTKDSGFADAVRRLITTKPPQLVPSPVPGETIKARILGLCGGDGATAWIQPMVTGFIGGNGNLIFLAPNTEWDGIQEKYAKEINTAARDLGLGCGFELWMWSGSSEWMKERQCSPPAT